MGAAAAEEDDERIAAEAGVGWRQRVMTGLLLTLAVVVIVFLVAFWVPTLLGHENRGA